jgi:hypothetical protein
LRHIDALFAYFSLGKFYVEPYILAFLFAGIRYFEDISYMVCNLPGRGGVAVTRYCNCRGLSVRLVYTHVPRRVTTVVIIAAIATFLTLKRSFMGLLSLGITAGMRSLSQFDTQTRIVNSGPPQQGRHEA